MPAHKVFGLDKLGVSLSTLCLVHCLAGPVFIMLLPAARVFNDENLFHRLIGPLLILTATLALMHGYRQHRHAFVPLLGLVGAACLAYGFLGPEAARAGFYSRQTLVTSIGSILLISAHLWNLRACRIAHA